MTESGINTLSKIDEPRSFDELNQRTTKSTIKTAYRFS